MTCRPCGAWAVCTIARFWVLWLLPFVRLILAPSQAVFALRDLLPAVGISLYAVAQWRCCRYRFRESENGCFHNMVVEKGFFVRRSLYLCAEDIACIEIERSPLLWLLRARRVRIAAADMRRRDAVLYLSETQANRLFSLPARGKPPATFRIWPIVVLSLSGSNTLTGLLTAVPILRSVSRLLGENTAEQLLSTGESLWVGVSPLIRRAANLLLFGWGLAVMGAFVRYRGFRARREGEQLHITSGLFTRRDVLVDCRKITALNKRQTLLMRLWGLNSVVISAAGYGRELASRPVLIPAAHATQITRIQDRLLPAYPLPHVTVHPASRFRYAAAPLSCLAALAVFSSKAPIPVVAVGGIVGVWWMLIRLLGFESAGLGVNKGGIAVCYPHALSLCRVQIPRENADRICVAQTPFQRLFGTCTVRVQTFGEKRRQHRVVGLPLEEVQALLN